MALRQVRSETHPFADQRIGVLVGGLLMFVIIAGGVSPRTFAFTPWILGLAIIVAGLWRRHKPHFDRAFLAVAATVLALPTWAVASSLWAAFPQEALGKAVSTLALAAMAVVAVAYLRVETRANTLRIAEGIWLGALLTAAYLAAEVWSSQSIRIAAINLLGLQPQDFATPKWFTWQNGRVVAADFGDLTRIVALLPLTLGPALLAAQAALATPWRTIVSVLTYLLILLAVFGAGSESAKIAAIIFTVTAALALASTIWTQRLLGIGWLAACLLMIPIVLGLHQLAPHRNSTVAKMFKDSSPEVRLEIWHDYASWSLDRPILGHGANHTYVWSKQMNAADPEPAGPPWKIRASQVWPHTHNMYLQVWYDLGAFGALLFTGLGIAVLWAIGRMPRPVQIAQMATFAAVAAFIPTSYGLWQPWLLGLFALVGILAVAAALPATVRRQ